MEESQWETFKFRIPITFNQIQTINYKETLLEEVMVAIQCNNFQRTITLK